MHIVHDDHILSRTVKCKRNELEFSGSKVEKKLYVYLQRQQPNLQSAREYKTR